MKLMKMIKSTNYTDPNKDKLWELINSGEISYRDVIDYFMLRVDDDEVKDSEFASYAQWCKEKLATW